MPFLRAWTIVGLVAWSLGCNPAGVQPQAADAEAVVRGMFAAAAAGDCVTLRRLIAGMDTDEACAEYIGGWRDESIVFVGIDRVSRDGRDPNAFLVRTRVRVAGEVREGVTRAVCDANGRWTVVVR